MLSGRRSILGLLVAVALATACGGAARQAPATPGDAAAARAEIAALMDRAAGDWTRGDLDAFMADYLPGEGTTYVGGRGLLRGVDAIRAAYAPRFAPGVPRDSLHFEGLEVDLLAPGVAHVLAFYVLSRGGAVTARGPTSLVMRRVEGRWRIVHDHSS
jgi:uncharacterized protein (TIGR02246 family)